MRLTRSDIHAYFDAGHPSKGEVSVARARMRYALALEGGVSVQSRGLSMMLGRTVRWTTALSTGALALLLAALGMASNAVPGDSFYALKTWSERVALSWKTDPADEAVYRLALARERMNELAILLTRAANDNKDTDAQTVVAMNTLSYATGVELGRAKEAIASAARVATDSRKLHQLVELAKMVGSQADQLHANIASLTKASSVADATQNISNPAVQAAEENSAKALSVFAVTVQQSKDTVESETKDGLRDTIYKKIQQQEKAINRVAEEHTKFQTANVTDVEAAKLALRKAQTLVDKEQYGDAVDQLNLSGTLMKDAQQDPGGGNALDVPKENTDTVKPATGVSQEKSTEPPTTTETKTTPEPIIQP